MDRPYVHINCASSLDGKIAAPDGSRLRISGPLDIERVHRLRARMGAILVGAGTVIADDPKLTVKEGIIGRAIPLTKIVLDGAGRLSSASRFLRTPGPSIILTTTGTDPGWSDEMKGLSASGSIDLELIELPGRHGRIDLASALGVLNERGISKVLVEGGSATIWEFVSGGFFDRFTVYFGPILVGGKGPTLMGGPGFGEKPMAVSIVEQEMSPDGGVLVEFARAVNG